MKGIRAYVVLMGLVLPALSACQRHSEDELRAYLGAWLDIGVTRHFQSQSDCTAFQAEIGSELVTGSLGLVHKLAEARRRMLAGRAVAVHMPGQTAAFVSEWFSNQDFGLGLAIVNSARAARPCMTPDFKTGFIEALRHPRTVLIFDPDPIALTIFDRDGGMAYHMRGAI